jgi:hypothetical protein
MLEDYIFTEEVPPNVEAGVEFSLFNHARHLMMQSPNGWQSFYLINIKHGRLEGHVHFYLEGSIAKSPLKAPFGSFEFADTLPLEQRYRFIKFSEEKLREHGIETIILKNPLRAYDDSGIALLEVFLLNHGWRVDEAEAGCIIDVGQPVESMFDAWEARKFRQASDAGLTFKALPAALLDEVYLFILTCRNKKNYNMSMTLKDLWLAFETFPDEYELFGLYHDNKLIAASITVKVTPRVMYHFYTDHDDSFDKLSPVVFLTVQLLKEAANRNIRFLDLGTSAIEGQPNFGLLNFKMRLGGIPSSKLTFIKSLK